MMATLPLRLSLPRALPLPVNLIAQMGMMVTGPPLPLDLVPPPLPLRPVPPPLPLIPAPLQQKVLIQRGARTTG